MNGRLEKWKMETRKQSEEEDNREGSNKADLV